MHLCHWVCHTYVLITMQTSYLDSSQVVVGDHCNRFQTATVAAAAESLPWDLSRHISQTATVAAAESLPCDLLKHPSHTSIVSIARLRNASGRPHVYTLYCEVTQAKIVAKDMDLSRT